MVTKTKKIRAKQEIRDVILPFSTEVDVKDYVNKDGSFRCILVDSHRVKTPMEAVFVHDETTKHEGKGEWPESEAFECRSIRIEWTDRLGNRQEVQVKLFT